jgi:hypothetical protein
MDRAVLELVMVRVLRPGTLLSCARVCKMWRDCLSDPSFALPRFHDIDGVTEWYDYPSFSELGTSWIGNYPYRDNLERMSESGVLSVRLVMMGIYLTTPWARQNLPIEYTQRTYSLRDPRFYIPSRSSLERYGLIHYGPLVRVPGAGERSIPERPGIASRISGEEEAETAVRVVPDGEDENDKTVKQSLRGVNAFTDADESFPDMDDMRPTMYRHSFTASPTEMESMLKTVRLSPFSIEAVRFFLDCGVRPSVSIEPMKLKLSVISLLVSDPRGGFHTGTSWMSGWSRSRECLSELVSKGDAVLFSHILAQTPELNLLDNGDSYQVSRAGSNAWGYDMPISDMLVMTCYTGRMIRLMGERMERALLAWSSASSKWSCYEDIGNGDDIYNRCLVYVLSSWKFGMFLYLSSFLLDVRSRLPPPMAVKVISFRSLFYLGCFSSLYATREPAMTERRLIFEPHWVVERMVAMGREVWDNDISMMALDEGFTVPQCLIDGY